MAERVDLGVVYRAVPETRLPVVDLPEQVQRDLKAWVSRVIVNRDVEWVHGGGFGSYQGLNDHVNRRLQAIAPECDSGDSCQLEVELAGVNSGDVAACAVSMHCPLIQDFDKELVEEREARCFEAHLKMGERLLAWTDSTARDIERLDHAIDEAETAVAAARRELDGLL